MMEAVGFSVGFEFFVGSMTLPKERISAAKFEQIVSIGVD